MVLYIEDLQHYDNKIIITINKIISKDIYEYNNKDIEKIKNYIEIYNNKI